MSQYQHQPYTYATLEQARDDLKAAAGADATNDPLMLENLLEATRRIDAYKGYPFVPVTKTWNLLLDESLDAPLFDHYTGTLILREPLLSLSGVTDTDGTALTVWDGTRAGLATAEVVPLPLEGPPYHAIQRWDGAGDPDRWDLEDRLLTLDGVWGYHPDYARAFVGSGQTLAAEMNSSASTFTIDSASGADAENYTPAFSEGLVIKIGSELMIVTDTAAGTPNDTVTVYRPALGTTAALHAVSSAISIYKPDRNIVRACKRLAAYLHRKRARFDDFVIDAAGVSITKFPADLPAEVEAILKQFPRYGRRAGVIGI